MELKVKNAIRIIRLVYTDKLSPMHGDLIGCLEWVCNHWNIKGLEKANLISLLGDAYLALMANFPNVEHYSGTSQVFAQWAILGDSNGARRVIDLMERDSHGFGEQVLDAIANLARD